MRPVELFYLPGCPYCVKAKKAVESLKAENADYERVPLKWIDESEEADYANEHNYYYVPSVFFRGQKIFEAHPGDSMEKIKAGIQSAFDRAVYDGPGPEYLSSVRES